MDAKMNLIGISHGYQHAIVLISACKLGVFDALGGETRTAGELAEKLGVDSRALEMLLLALTADGFLVQTEEGFRVAPDYAPYLLTDETDNMLSILRHNYTCLRQWAQLVEVVKTGDAPRRQADGFAADELRDFICGMANISRTSSVEVGNKFDFSGYRRMLDLGGGPATSSITLAKMYRGLKCVVFDLEDTLEIAREEIVKAGLQDRIETRVGDYFEDEFGEKFDLVYISNIIHSTSPENTLMILEKSHRALVSGGTVMLKDFFLEDNRTEPDFAAFFSINMLVNTECGKSYTLTETKDLLTQAGFGKFKTIEVAMASRLLIARKL